MHFFDDVEVVVARGTVCAETDGDAFSASWRWAQSHWPVSGAARVVGDADVFLEHDVEVVVIDPDAVRSQAAYVKDAQVVEPGDSDLPYCFLMFSTSPFVSDR